MPRAQAPRHRAPTREKKIVPLLQPELVIESADRGEALDRVGGPVPEEQLDARLDDVLAKIAREGREGLTEEEHRVLQEASRRARNRRSDRL